MMHTAGTDFQITETFQQPPPPPGAQNVSSFEIYTIGRPYTSDCATYTHLRHTPLFTYLI